MVLIYVINIPKSNCQNSISQKPCREAGKLDQVEAVDFANAFKYPFPHSNPRCPAIVNSRERDTPSEIIGDYRCMPFKVQCPVSLFVFFFFASVVKHSII